MENANHDEMNDTICAISTPYGIGGIAVIRVSGSEAIAIVDGLFRGRRRLSESKGGTVVYGAVCDRDVKGDRDLKGQEGKIIDEVMVSVLRAPHSFTGEDTVEISCHGSLFIQQEILQALVDAGCRTARAGEFTERAFLNGKMDLSEAEAVADLIAARTKAGRDMALKQLRGGVSDELASLRERLLHLTSLVELELDFADHEELEFADRSELKSLADEIEKKLKRLTDSFKTGQAIREGVTVAIVGATNAGKSTLLNALVGEERAIVSDIDGTTRDTIEDTLILDGVLFRLIDTAGIRETKDTIEAMGIERSRQAMERAMLIVEVIDATQPQPMEGIDEERVIRVYNKTDLVSTTTDALSISAKNGEIEALKKEMVRRAALPDTGETLISNTRHYEALSKGLDAIRRVQQGLATGLSGELMSMDLQDCLSALGEVTGQITSQEVLNTIFSKFCIGK